jgi:hypothetical protein
MEAEERTRRRKVPRKKELEKVTMRLAAAKNRPMSFTGSSLIAANCQVV